MSSSFISGERKTQKGKLGCTLRSTAKPEIYWHKKGNNFQEEQEIISSNINGKLRKIGILWRGATLHK